MQWYYAFRRGPALIQLSHREVCTWAAHPWGPLSDQGPLFTTQQAPLYCVAPQTHPEMALSHAHGQNCNWLRL